jgi:hypothetical protein
MSRSWAIAVSMVATSVTVRPIGPAVSHSSLMGTTRSRLTNPSEGRIPTTDALAEGATIEPAVSVPTAIAARFIVTATADPVDDPKGSIPSP